MRDRPDFIIIGAMKCATSTLHDQLAAQPGFFMTEPKELYFFSDDPVYARGLDWYASHFRAAQPSDLCGESTTHYTKLPTYPKTIERLKDYVPQARFIYVMRHPIDRLVSQYIHEWSMNVVSEDINDAVKTFPEMVYYSQYTMQLKPYFEAFGSDRVLPVFFERMLTASQDELERICAFLGYGQSPIWQTDLNAKNVSRQRERRTPFLNTLIETPMLATLRRVFVPKAFRNYVRGFLTMKKRPELSPETLQSLKAVFDPDLAELGHWLGIENLSCDTYQDLVKQAAYSWVNVPMTL